MAAAAPSPLPVLGGEEQPWGAPGLISSGGFVPLWLPLLPARSGAQSHGVLVWGSPLTELVLCFTLAAQCPWALPCAPVLFVTFVLWLPAGRGQPPSRGGTDPAGALLGCCVHPRYGRGTGPKVACLITSLGLIISVGGEGAGGTHLLGIPSRRSPAGWLLGGAPRPPPSGGCLLLAACSYPVFWRRGVAVETPALMGRG